MERQEIDGGVPLPASGGQSPQWPEVVAGESSWLATAVRVAAPMRSRRATRPRPRDCDESGGRWLSNDSCANGRRGSARQATTRVHRPTKRSCGLPVVAYVQPPKACTRLWGRDTRSCDLRVTTWACVPWLLFAEVCGYWRARQRDRRCSRWPRAGTPSSTRRRCPPRLFAVHACAGRHSSRTRELRRG